MNGRPQAAISFVVRGCEKSCGSSLSAASEAAFALVLLAGAGLLMRTFAGLTAIAPGFHPEKILTARLSLPYWKYRTTERQRFEEGTSAVHRRE
jgi:predicted alpha/beta-hydrolase family hydrolase